MAEWENMLHTIRGVFKKTPNNFKYRASRQRERAAVTERTCVSEML